jgi:hypothetical protein
MLNAQKVGGYDEVFVKMLLELGVRNPQSTACDDWCLCFQDIA